MANYYMHDYSIDCDLSIDLLTLDLNYLYETIIEEIDEALGGIDFVLNKYSRDNKKAYESSQQYIIDKAREDKMELLLKKRLLLSKISGTIHD
tara:strand:- start:1463 stop:1741 length:279 start_codon:yes stop_codon:yes gene_type:complete